MIDIENKLIKASKFMNPELFKNDYEYIKREVEDLFSPTHLIEMILSYIRVYRVRKIDDIDIEYSVEDFWIPPANKVDIGRCNLKGNPIFYGALDPLTAIRELELTINDTFLISCYDMNGYTNESIGKTVYFGIPKEVEHTDKNYILATRIASNFAFNEFTREITRKSASKRYQVTNAIVDHVFSQKQYDSIIYPSVKRPSNFNIVVTEESAKLRLKLADVFICRLIKDEGDTVTIDIIKQGTNLRYKETFEYDKHIHLKQLIVNKQFFGDKLTPKIRQTNQKYSFF